jgi:hypothetical protein
MRGQKVVVTIIDKHWMFPWPVVEARLRELITQCLSWVYRGRR